LSLDKLSGIWCREFGEEICSTDEWLVWLRRVDNSVSFSRTWDEYKEGFGQKRGNFWIGLENLHKITNPRRKTKFKIHTSMQFWEGTETKGTNYGFKVANESDGYRLSIGAKGLFSDINKDIMIVFNGQRFSTFDKDQDKEPGNCAHHYGGGWWFRGCGRFFPTSLVAPFGEEKSGCPYMYALGVFEEDPRAGISFLTMKIAPWENFGPG